MSHKAENHSQLSQSNLMIFDIMLMDVSAGNGEFVSKMSYKTENHSQLSQNLYFDKIKSS